MTQEMVLYETVADSITGMISAGTLRPGERVPSVRRLSTQRRISVATVLRAYEVLENRGLIEARPNAGYYVRHRSLSAESSISRSRFLLSTSCMVVRHLHPKGNINNEGFNAFQKASD